MLKSDATILISRTDAIGDVVLSLPVVGFLKQRYPMIRVLFLGRAYTRAIIENDTDVDRFIDWDEWKDLSSKEQASRLCAEKVDVFIHLFPRKEIASLAKKVRIPVVIGTKHRWFHWFRCTHLVGFSRRKSDLHESQLNFELLRPFGVTEVIPLDRMTDYLHLKKPDLPKKVMDLLDTQRFNLILHPKSAGSAREWEQHNFVSLIGLLNPKEFKIFVCGTSADGKLIQESLLNKVAHEVVDLTGKLSLEEYMGLIATAQGMVAASTGPLHIAGVYGLHTVGLFSPKRPIHPGRWQPIGPHIKVFCAEEPCADCVRKTKVSCSCLEAISPRSVATYLEECAKRYFKTRKEK